jgi:hypothetical protein
VGRKSNIERAALRGDWAKAEKLARAELKRAHRLGPREERLRSADWEEHVEPAVEEEDDPLPTDLEERTLRPRDDDPPPRALTPRQQRMAELAAKAEATRRMVLGWQEQRRRAAAERQAAEQEALERYAAEQAKYEKFRDRDSQQWRGRQPPPRKARDFASKIATAEFGRQVLQTDRGQRLDYGGDNWARVTLQADHWDRRDYGGDDWARARSLEPIDAYRGARPIPRPAYPAFFWWQKGPRGRPRKHIDNAAKQAAYREAKKLFKEKR